MAKSLQKFIIEGVGEVTDVRCLREWLGALPEAIARPFLVVLSGLPGTGKTFFCRELVKRVTAVVLESDRLSKVLFPVPDYSPEESARLFGAAHRLTGELLERGIPVIFDATNISEHSREGLCKIAGRLGVKLVLVRVAAAPEVVHQRLSSSQDRGHSDAGWDVYLMMRQQEERIRRRHFTVDTTEDTQLAVDRIVREINR